MLALYLFSFVETPRKFIIAELSIRKLGSSSVLIVILVFNCSQLHKNVKNHGTHNNVLYVVFHELSDDINYFSNQAT